MCYSKFWGQKQNMERTVKGYSCCTCFKLKELNEASHQGFIHASGGETSKP